MRLLPAQRLPSSSSPPCRTGSSVSSTTLQAPCTPSRTRQHHHAPTTHTTRFSGAALLVGLVVFCCCLPAAAAGSPAPPSSLAPSPTPPLKTPKYATADPPPLLRSPPEPTASVPPFVDWRERGAVTSVKDEDECGACWAFAAAALVEAKWAMEGYGLTNVSVQQFLSCDTQGNLACDGGDAEAALDWLINDRGGWATSAHDYPYTSGYIGDRGVCLNEPPKPRAARVTASIRLPLDEEQMAAYLAVNGPIATSINSSKWVNYTGGVMTNCEPGDDADHTIVLVGYNRTAEAGSEPYWIVKSTFGTEWGHGGYLYLGFGRQECGIAYHEAAIAALLEPPLAATVTATLLHGTDAHEFRHNIARALEVPVVTVSIKTTPNNTNNATHVNATLTLMDLPSSAAMEVLLSDTMQQGELGAEPGTLRISVEYHPVTSSGADIKKRVGIVSAILIAFLATAAFVAIRMRRNRQPRSPLSAAENHGGEAQPLC